MSQNVATICDGQSLGKAHTPRSVSPVSTPEDPPPTNVELSSNQQQQHMVAVGVAGDGLPSSMSDSFTTVHAVEVGLTL